MEKHWKKSKIYKTWKKNTYRWRILRNQLWSDYLHTFRVNINLIGRVLLNFKNLWNCTLFISIHGWNNAWFWIILIKFFFSDLEIGKFLKKATMATTRMNKKGYLSLTSPRSLMKFLVDEGAFWRNFLQSRFVKYKF